MKKTPEAVIIMPIPSEMGLHIPKAPYPVYRVIGTDRKKPGIIENFLPLSKRRLQEGVIHKTDD